MADVQARPAVDAWVLGDARMERYRHAPGPTAVIPPHSHEEHQFGVNPTAPGEYRTRGVRHAIPAGAVRLIQSGEPHASRDDERPNGSVALLLYVPPASIRAVAADVAGRDGTEPAFSDPVVDDPFLAGALAALFAALDRDASRLEQDERLLGVVSGFVARHAETRSAPRPAGREPAAVVAARDYLDAHAAEPVLLADLAALVGLNPHYLCRVFARTEGMSPHRYQLMRRIERAKRLLGAGEPIRETAQAVGFADQSHFGRFFRRFMGVPPGRYAVRTGSVGGGRTANERPVRER
jgi:AraC-like DNA-binding protein